MPGTQRDSRDFQGMFEGFEETQGDCAPMERWGGGSAAQGAWVDSVPAGLTEPAPLDPPSAWLVHAIETEIIPRLMLAHREPALHLVPREPHVDAPGPEHVAALASLILKREPAEAEAYVEHLRAQGVALELIYLDLLAPTARRLGELWESDECAFTDVTVGLWRLQQVMFELSPEFHAERAPGTRTRRALLAPAPGSQHTFGLFMVAEFFRRSGWQVMGNTTLDTRELLSIAHNEWFDVIGLSAGAGLHVEGLTSVIVELRRTSVNPQVAVLVGGPVFTEHPELLHQVGADGTAADAPGAVIRAESLVAAREKR